MIRKAADYILPIAVLCLCLGAGYSQGRADCPTTYTYTRMSTVDMPIHSPSYPPDQPRSILMPTTNGPNTNATILDYAEAIHGVMTSRTNALPTADAFATMLEHYADLVRQGRFIPFIDDKGYAPGSRAHRRDQISRGRA